MYRARTPRANGADKPKMRAPKNPYEKKSIMGADVPRARIQMMPTKNTEKTKNAPSRLMCNLVSVSEHATGSLRVLSRKILLVINLALFPEIMQMP